MFYMKMFDYTDLGKISSYFASERRRRFGEFVMRVLSVERVNRLYDHNKDLRGVEFTAGLLNDIGVNYSIGNSEILHRLPAGPFITISNHPYGGIDGIMLVDLIASIRPDYKVMVNSFLAMVRAMNDHFIKVTPVGNSKKNITAASINGIRETLSRLRSGHPVGFFPSGAVSDFSIREMRVRDRRWQDSILRLIRSAKVPVLPVRFFDHNSSFFFFLGLIDWRIRLLRLPSEVFNKSKKQTRLGIGELITVEEQEKSSDFDSFYSLLRNAIYGMPVPRNFLPRKLFNHLAPEIENKFVI
jgi:putative hemolysin